jgi:hypothetical protein
MKHNAQELWEAYCREELALLRPVLEKLGYVLDEKQPHLSGERYLMRAVSTASGKKLILLGQEKGEPVVIKATRDLKGVTELSHERRCRKVLDQIRFAYGVFRSPEERFFGKRAGFTISVNRFVGQDLPFLSRPVIEQFTLALSAFKAQESAHAATFEQRQLASRVFGSRTGIEYLRAFDEFAANLGSVHPSLPDLLPAARALLAENVVAMEQYGSFLTHTDFVPHNFRVLGGEIYLLDHSSLRFGNKYEGWARFLNYMALYNPELTVALETYVRDNRTPEEVLTLKLMRLYRLAEIIWYYANTLSESAGDLRALNQARITFWVDVLSAVLGDRPLPEAKRAAYIETRDSLRSETERERQKAIA